LSPDLGLLSKEHILVTQMKFLRLSAVLAATIISFVPGLPKGVIAQEGDYACFMTTKSGQVIDLSESVCKLKKATPVVTAAASSDQAFTEDYKRTVMNYPDVRDNLLARAEKSPEQGIIKAKSVCNELKAGLSLDEIKETQASETFEKASTFNASLISSLATKYYCPEFSEQ
jgi:hypothetical protein